MMVLTYTSLFAYTYWGRLWSYSLPTKSAYAQTRGPKPRTCLSGCSLVSNKLAFLTADDQMHTQAPTDGLDHADVLRKWEEEQEELRRSITEDDVINWDIASSGVNPQGARPLRLVAGVDLSFYEEDPSQAVASLVVLSFPSLEVVFEAYSRVRLQLPYVSGYLAFREVGPLRDLLDGLRNTQPALYPDVVLVDGNGVLHPRGCGLACHLGLLTQTPTIGCAKTLLHVDGLVTTEVKHRLQTEIPTGQGGSMLLQGTSGKVLGAALRPSANVQNPIYVSVGTGLSLDTALAIVRACCKFRVPEPIRQADIRSRALIREAFSTPALAQEQDVSEAEQLAVDTK